MNHKDIEKIVDTIAPVKPWVYRSDITDILEMLNKNKMLHPPRDDTFFWDKETVEADFPNVCKEIRREEREKTIRDAITALKEL